MNEYSLSWWLIFGCFYSYVVYTRYGRLSIVKLSDSASFWIFLSFNRRIVAIQPPQFNCFVWPPFWSILYHTRIYIYVITCILTLSLKCVVFFCRRVFLVCSKLLSPYFWFVSLVTCRLNFNDLNTCNLQQYWLEEWKS